MTLKEALEFCYFNAYFFLKSYINKIFIFLIQKNIEALFPLQTYVHSFIIILIY